MKSSDYSWFWWISIIVIGVWLKFYVEGTISGDVCFNETVTIPCGALRNVNGADDVEWKVYDAESSQWMTFYYCNKRMACEVMEPILPNGITVENISNGTLTLKASAKNNTNGQSRLLCQVHYGQNSVDHGEVKINFIVCIRTKKAADVNLTEVFQSMLPWQHVIDIEIYNSNNSRLAYCNADNCIKIAESDFWNRLQVKQGSLLLTEVRKSDDRLEIAIKVHLGTSSVDTQLKSRRDVDENMETARVYTLKILVYSSQEPKSVPPSTSPSTAGTDSPSLPLFKHVGSPTRSGTSAARGKLWITIMIPTIFGIVAL